MQQLIVVLFSFRTPLRSTFGFDEKRYNLRKRKSSSRQSRCQNINIKFNRSKSGVESFLFVVHLLIDFVGSEC